MRGMGINMYENISIETVVITVTTSCNLSCAHCFNRKNDDIGHMDYDSIAKIINKFSLYGASEIVISGGEPLLHPDIDKIVLIPLLYPKIKFIIATNGMLLTDDLIAQMEKVDNLSIQISMDGSNIEIYEKQRGTGSYSEFYRGFLLLAQSSVRCITSKIAVTKINYRDVENIYKLSVDNGILPSFQFVSSAGNAKDNWNYLGLNVAQKIYVIDTIKKMNIQYCKDVPIPMPGSGCEFSEYQERKAFVIRADGSVIACLWLYDHPIGNILHDSLPAILKGDAMMRLYEMGHKRYEKRNMSSLCINCVIRSYCRLGCLGIDLIDGDESVHDDCALRKADVALGLLSQSKC